MEIFKKKIQFKNVPFFNKESKTDTKLRNLVIDEDGNLIVDKEVSNSNSNENYIPLTGTEEGKPITGDIEIERYSGVKIKSGKIGDVFNLLDLTRVDEGFVIEHYNDDGNLVADLMINGANVQYSPQSGAELSSIGFSSTMNHSDATSGNEESDKLIYAQRAYVDRYHSYSEDETMIGTWIDGKPIYRSVFVLNSADYSVPFPFVFTHNLNIENYLLHDIVIPKSNSTQEKVLRYNIADAINNPEIKYLLYFNLVTSFLENSIESDTSIYKNGDNTIFYIILEYTKITN